MAKLRPEVIEIPFGTEKHRMIIEAIRQRKLMSKFYMQNRYDQWAKMEERFRAYVNLTDNDIRRKSLKSQGKPQYITIDIPYSYAMLLTAHTYWTSVFLSRSPVLQYLARSGTNTNSEQAVEAILDYQVQTANMLMPLYLWFMDAGKYGMGVIGNGWYEEETVVTEIAEVPASYFGIPIPGKTKKVRQTKLIRGYSGNKSFNIRPQDFYPDPRVPVWRLQEGEFCGRIIECGWNTVVKREQQGWYYNVEALRQNLKTTRDYIRDPGSPQIILPAAMDTLYYRGQPEDGAVDVTGKNKKAFIETMEMTVELAPKDWGLGTSEYPEKWAFTVGNDAVILNAMPTGAAHGKFEFFPLEYEIEGYALSKRSMLEIVDPLNDVLSWLFNSHMYNVRKALNDQLVVDPSRITMKDLTDPTSGRIIRLKPEAYGTNPSESVHQLAVGDVTQQHLGNMEVVTSLMQRVLGVTENVMGMVNQGGRKTATEVRTSSTFGINRLKTNCEYMSAMGFTPWARVLLQNTQQRYDQQKQLRIAGRPMSGPQSMVVTPDDIAGEYDFVPIDGTMPVDRFALANLWKELAGAMMKIPPVAQQMDWMGIMGWIAQLGGLKNFDQFKLQVNVVPDQVAAAQARAGNVVPLNTGGQSGGTGTGGGGESGATNVPGAPRVAGVGPTG